MVNEQKDELSEIVEFLIYIYYKHNYKIQNHTESKLSKKKQ